MTTPGRAVVTASLAAAGVVAAVLAVLVSVWFFLATPLLLTAAYAAWVGLSPGRFVEALDDGSRPGTFPF